MALPPSSDIERLESYLNSLEQLVLSSLAVPGPDFASVEEAFYRLWHDVDAGHPFDVGLRDLDLPPFPEFQQPFLELSGLEEPGRVPSSVAPSLMRCAGRWACRKRWVVGGICAGVVGAGLLAYYRGAAIKVAANRLQRKAVRTLCNAPASAGRKQAIVVLGGDTLLGLHLVASLEMAGFIVIASVSTPEAIPEVEAKCNGYVRALLLDPEDESTIQSFLRSLQSTLSLRFPIDSPADPHHASPAMHPQIHSLISLLALPLLPPLHLPASSPATLTPPWSARLTGPFTRLPPTSTYTSYLTRTHIVPLRAIHTLLPLFRLSSARARDARGRTGVPRSIIVCVPKAAPYASGAAAAAQVASAAATACGVDALKSELSTAAREMLGDVRVVTVDVDFDVDVDPHQLASKDVNDFVNVLVDTVGGGRDGSGRPKTALAFKVQLWHRNVRIWWRGERFCVGGRSRNYAYNFASGVISNLPLFLQTPILDFVQSLAQTLSRFHDRLKENLPVPPTKGATLPREAPVVKVPAARSTCSVGVSATSSRNSPLVAHILVPDVSVATSSLDRSNRLGEGESLQRTPSSPSSLSASISSSIERVRAMSQAMSAAGVGSGSEPGDVVTGAGIGDSWVSLEGDSRRQSRSVEEED